MTSCTLSLSQSGSRKGQGQRSIFLNSGLKGVSEKFCCHVIQSRIRSFLIRFVCLLAFRSRSEQLRSLSPHLQLQISSFFPPHQTTSPFRLRLCSPPPNVRLYTIADDGGNRQEASIVAILGGRRGAGAEATASVACCCDPIQGVFALQQCGA